MRARRIEGVLEAETDCHAEVQGQLTQLQGFGSGLRMKADHPTPITVLRLNLRQYLRHALSALAATSEHTLQLPFEDIEAWPGQAEQMLVPNHDTGLVILDVSMYIDAHAQLKQAHMKPSQDVVLQQRAVVAFHLGKLLCFDPLSIAELDLPCRYRASGLNQATRQ